MLQRILTINCKNKKEKSIKYVMCLIILFTFSSCISHPKTNLDDPEATERLLNQVLKGDTTAYYEISVDFFLEYKSKEFLYYALIMANQYNNAQAHNDIYHILTSLSDNKIETLDTVTRNLAIYHLKKSEELGSNLSEEEKETLKSKEGL